MEILFQERLLMKKRMDAREAKVSISGFWSMTAPA